MSKKSIIERHFKKILLNIQYNNYRNNLLKELNYIDSWNKYLIILSQLNKIPKNSIKIKIHNRCWKTGHSRGYLNHFGLCRKAFRELALNGYLPGVFKSSW
jgi:small subunit ribosomal protein S14